MSSAAPLAAAMPFETEAAHIKTSLNTLAIIIRRA